MFIETVLAFLLLIQKGVVGRWMMMMMMVDEDEDEDDGWLMSDDARGHT